MKEQKLDARNGLYLAEPLDTWLSAGQHDYAIPEAAGSSARVFLLKSANGERPFKREPAFKVMRHDKLAYAKPLFLEEYHILAGLQGLNNLTPMLAAGYLKPDSGTAWPAEIAPLSKDLVLQAEAAHITGTLIFFEPDEVEDLLAEYEQRLADGWLPFVVLERRWEEDELSETLYQDVPFPERQLLALTHSLIKRGLVSEEDLQRRMKEVHERLNAT